MMGGQALLNQGFILWRKRQVVDLQGAADKQLALLNRQGRQFFQNFGKAHGAKITCSPCFAKLPVNVGRKLGTALAERLPQR